MKPRLAKNRMLCLLGSVSLQTPAEIVLPLASRSPWHRPSGDTRSESPAPSAFRGWSRSAKLSFMTQVEKAVRKLLVASQKSGVGKTTTAINLAAATSMSGARVLLLETDPLASVDVALKLSEHPDRKPLRLSGIEIPGVLCRDILPGLDVLNPFDEGCCSDEHLDQVLQILESPAIQEEYDCLIINAPPFLAGHPALLLRSCDEYIVVMQAEPLAHRTLPAFLELVQRTSQQEGLSVRMQGILLTLPENEGTNGHWEHELRGRFGGRILPQCIPYDEEVPRAQLFGHVFVHASPESPAALEYKELVTQLQLTRNISPSARRRTIEATLVTAAASVRPRALPMRKPNPRSKSNTTRHSAPIPPTPAFRGDTPVAPSSPDADAGKPAWTPPVLTPRGSGVRPSLRATPEPLPDTTNTPLPSPQSTPPGNNLLWVILAIVAAFLLGVGMRFAPLGNFLQPDLMMPLAVGVATAGIVGLVVWFLQTQQPNEPPSNDPPRKR